MTDPNPTHDTDGGADPAPPVGDERYSETTESGSPGVTHGAGEDERYSEATESGPAGVTHEAGAPAELSREELEVQLAETQVALSMAEAQRDEHLADLQRKAAELANVLKREQKNAHVGRLEGRIDVMRSLLDVLDDFDRTRDAALASEDEALRSGVGMVHDKLRTALAGHGLTRVGEPGEAFDPNRHEAVQQVEAEDGPLDEPVVDQVFRPGYLVGDRVVRAAMVVVRQ